MKFHQSHLSYCTNIHPAETWAETFACCEPTCWPCATACGRRLLGSTSRSPSACGCRPWPRGSCWQGENLAAFRDWLAGTNTYVFTINGFPYGNFHGTRVKEQVFQPDWTETARLEYTKDLFRILAAIARPGTGASVSTLPGSHKTFHADESLIRRQPHRTGGVAGGTVRGNRP